MINIIQAGRRWGKTRRAVAWLHGGRVVDGKWSRLLICAYSEGARHIIQEYGIPPQLVMSLEEWRRSERGLGNDLEIMVDDADRIIKDALRLHPGVRLAGITWNDDDEKFVDENFWHEERLRKNRERMYTKPHTKKAHAERLDDQLEITRGQEQLNFE